MHYEVIIRIHEKLYSEIINDLKRDHTYAYERVGFLFTTTKKLKSGTILIICKKYSPVADSDYINDKNVGAKINSDAIRKVMQEVLDNKYGCFHVHLHSQKGKPHPSTVDQKSLPEIVEVFENIEPSQRHGIVIFSEDSIYSEVIINSKLYNPDLFSIVGYPLKLIYNNNVTYNHSDKYERQSFLGQKSNLLFQKVKVGIIGYGGGGSHIGQQLAHIGIKNIKVFDEQSIADTNINRLIGAYDDDLKNNLLKVKIAERTIKNILSDSKVVAFPSKWQDNSDELQDCDVIMSCVDSYSERQQLEAICRRYLIPLIDIGMDVYVKDDFPPYISGQLILSMPGMPCMQCMGFLTASKLEEEGARYGNAGGRPQVVWPNGVLASSAVGTLIDLITNWTLQRDRILYLSYDGNLGTLNNHVRINYLNSIGCNHYQLSNIGPPIFYSSFNK